MPVDWAQFECDLDSIIKSGAERTDDRLASRVSSVTRMTDEEVKALFPEPSDLKKLTELMRVVKDATDQNTKINNIVSNAEEFAKVILTLLQKFA